MARKYKVLEKSNANLTQQKQEAKLNAEILASDGLPLLSERPPSTLVPAAQTEWKRIVPELNKLPVRDLDHATVEMYCTWYGMYRDVQQKIKKGKAADRLEWVGFLDKITKNIKGLASDLGLNVDSRMRMFMPSHDDKNQKKGIMAQFDEE